MPKTIEKSNPTSIIIRFKLLNSSSTTGAGLTGLSKDSAGLIIATLQAGEAAPTLYKQSDSTLEIITTLGTYAAPTATKARFKEIDATNMKGVYELQLADARFDSTKSLILSLSGAANLAEADFEIQCENIAVQVKGLDANVITATSIQDNAIAAAKLADNAITAAKIAADAITNAKIADGAISVGKVADNTITAAKLASDAITAAKIASDAITAAKIASDAITSSKIADGAITANKIAAAAFTLAKLASDFRVKLDASQPDLSVALVSTIAALNNLSSTDAQNATAAALAAYNTTGVAKEATVQGIQNNTNFVASIAEYYLIPAAGSTVYKIQVAFYDEAGNMEDPDSNDFGLLLKDAGDTAKNAILFKEFACSNALDNSGISGYKKLMRTDVGLYYCFVKIASTESVAQFMYNFAIDEDSVRKYFTRTNLVVAEEPGSVTLADNTTNADIVAKSLKSRDVSGTAAVTGSIYDDLVAEIAGVPTVAEIRAEMDDHSTKLANLDATVSSRSTLDAQGARDALQLAPTAPGGAAGSIDDMNKFPDGEVYLSEEGASDSVTTYPAGERNHPVKQTAGATCLTTAVSIATANKLRKIRVVGTRHRMTTDGAGQLDRFHIIGGASHYQEDLGTEAYPSIDPEHEITGATFERMAIGSVSGQVNGKTYYGFFKTCRIMSRIFINGGLFEDCEISGQPWFKISGDGIFKNTLFKNCRFSLESTYPTWGDVGIRLQGVSNPNPIKVRIDDCSGRLLIGGMASTAAVIYISGFQGEIVIDGCTYGTIIIRGGAGKLTNYNSADPNVIVQKLGFNDESTPVSTLTKQDVADAMNMNPTDPSVFGLLSLYGKVSAIYKKTIWVDTLNGDDGNTGISLADAVQTIAEGCSRFEEYEGGVLYVVGRFGHGYGENVVIPAGLRVVGVPGASSYYPQINGVYVSTNTPVVTLGKGSTIERLSFKKWFANRINCLVRMDEAAIVRKCHSYGTPFTGDLGVGMVFDLASTMSGRIEDNDLIGGSLKIDSAIGDTVGGGGRVIIQRNQFSHYLKDVIDLEAGQVGQVAILENNFIDVATGYHAIKTRPNRANVIVNNRYACEDADFVLETGTTGTEPSNIIQNNGNLKDSGDVIGDIIDSFNKVVTSRTIQGNPKTYKVGTGVNEHTITAEYTTIDGLEKVVSETVGA